MQIYQERISVLEKEGTKLKVRDNQLAVVRLLCIISFLVFGYQFLVRGDLIWLFSSFAALIGFLWMIKLHDAVRWKQQFAVEKSVVIRNEIAFLNGDLSPFDNGSEYIDPSHPYSYDLDFFGDHSIFQLLNRTGTFSGKKNLSRHLSRIQSKDSIERTQKAVSELSQLTDWRQDFQTLARMQPDTESAYKGLLTWSTQEPATINTFARLLSFLLPFSLILCCISYLVDSTSIQSNVIWLLFLTNLGILGAHLKSLKKELVNTTKIEKILMQYGWLLREIEGQSFTSELLIELQNRLKTQQVPVSEAIDQLARLFGRMEHLQNVFASPLLNGFLLYHIHMLRQLTHWRKKYAHHISEWLDTIGKFETLNSIANFSYNRPEFVFPEINDRNDIIFEDLGHPLILKKKPITNTISFSDYHFFILTGSNMSGKSTFLRAVGTNVVLAGIGAPVFASKATVHPLPLMVSMRLSDSLADSESLFFAEVKRLQSIMAILEERPCFVLLDEILRGTNSDDKRNGTMEVIRKLAAKKAFGGIATHDLEVCNVSKEFPDLLINKRFEVEIVDDELVFDYKLRDGICENKSASFIMKKMGVI